MGENVKHQSEYSVNILITKGSITIFILIYGLFFFLRAEIKSTNW